MSVEQKHAIDDRPASVAQLFLSRVRNTPDQEAYRYPVPEGSDGDGERWESLTWGDTAGRVTAIAAGLVSLGIRPEDRVAIAAGTRVEWILADLAIMCAGAATTTVYPSTDADETAYILADSGSRVVFAEGPDQVAKVRAERGRLPELTAVITFDPVPAVEDDVTVLGLPELERRGTDHLASQPDLIERIVAAIDREQLATLIYTSGTTGRPKGVRLVHDCWSYQAVAQQAMGLVRDDDVHFLWLPLAHAFGKTLLAGQIAVGFPTAVDGRIEKIITNLPVVQPTFMAAAPRIFEKVYNGVAARARAAGGLKHKIFQWAAEVARDTARAHQRSLRATGERSAPLALRVQHAIADRLVYAKIRAAFGGRMRACVSGSAPLAPDIGYFFDGVGIRILEGYGLTETSAGSTINPEDARVGTVGRPLPGTEVRIAADGEVLLRGPGVMRGYHGLPEQTAAVMLEDGWFATGDIGELDDEGFLRITDRKKDLFKTSGGKYVAPSEIEGRFKAVCPFVSAIVVIGDARNYCAALITLEEQSIMAWAAENGMGDRSYAEVCTSDPVQSLMGDYISELNEQLQRWQTIKRFAVLPRDFDMEHGEVTPSLKVKRAAVQRRYAAEIEQLYEGARER